MTQFFTRLLAGLCFSLSLPLGGEAIAYDHRVELNRDRPQDPTVTGVRIFNGFYDAFNEGRDEDSTIW